MYRVCILLLWLAFSIYTIVATYHHVVQVVFILHLLHVCNCLRWIRSVGVIDATLLVRQGNHDSLLKFPSTYHKELAKTRNRSLVVHT
jgi:hypothetical protein